jgi:hypothetical protein
MSTPNGNASQPVRVPSPFVFVLALLLAVGGVTAALLAVVYVANKLDSADKPKTGGVATLADSEPYTQQGTLKPEGQGSGLVYYPVPYASPPHLTLSPGSRYLIVRQDEFGFTWLDRARVKDFAGLVASVPELSGAISRAETEKFDPNQPDIAWEAKGLRGGAAMEAMRPFQQSGTFQSEAGQQGQVNFPIPYASPPNVELSGNSSRTIISECTATGFKWKNNAGPNGPSWDSGEVKWRSKGIRATQLPKN